MTRPDRLPLLADENIHPEVVAGLRTRGHEVTTVVELGLAGRPDLEILNAALAGQDRTDEPGGAPAGAVNDRAPVVRRRTMVGEASRT